MKKLISLLIALVIMYAIYYDLKIGTLPHTIKETSEVMSEVKVDKSYFEHKVNPGDTVLSIIEKKLKQPLSISIDEVIIDFKTLNPGQKPEEIQIGKSYKFPDYNKR